MVLKLKGDKKLKMAVRRVLVLYKCRRFVRQTSTRQQTKSKQTIAKVLVNVTHFRFLLYTMANLFHSVLDKSL